MAAAPSEGACAPPSPRARAAPSARKRLGGGSPAARLPQHAQNGRRARRPSVRLWAGAADLQLLRSARYPAGKKGKTKERRRRAYCLSNLC